MGCATSKVEDLPAVALCRERCNFLDEAIRQRYAFAASHVGYLHSLRDLGASLDLFFEQYLDASAGVAPPSPVLPLPPQKKANSTAAAPAVVNSHIDFHTDSDQDDDEDGSLHHSGNSSPLHYEQHMDGSMMPPAGGFMGMNMNMNMHFMKNRASQSVVHEQRPMNPETVYMGESSSSSYYPSSYYSNQQENLGSFPGYSYGGAPNYTHYANYSMMGSPSRYGPAYYPPQNVGEQASTSSSKPPPPPPSPPRNSPWDFLNPFDTFDRYYPQTTPSRDSKEVREEEGIPDLEDENYRDEVVKEVHGEQKFGDGGGGEYSKMRDKEDDEENDGEKLYRRERQTESAGSNTVEYDVHMVDKNVIEKEQRMEERNNVPTFKARGGSLGTAEVIREIKAQFERASESGNEVAKMLEAGKVPYARKNAVYQVSSKVLHSITPSMPVVSSLPSPSKDGDPSSSAEKAGSALLEFDNGIGGSSKSLSSTLQKLYIWEKKLYEEVKAEEKMRIGHERKCRKLKRLDERGAEAHKLDTTRTLIRNLSTKIRIAIQVVDKISIKINKLRDEELWPQMNELIRGLISMWTVMLECHQNQCQAIAEAKNLDAIASNKKFSDDHLLAAWRLEHELLKWISNFTGWVGAQKGYVTALNGWLRRCLPDETEETPDGPAPFSPGRMGAPPVFVICNQWSQAMERISEQEVVDAMRVFATMVHQLSERHNMELRQRMVTDRDLERKVKQFEREEQKMNKEWQAVDKKMIMISGQGLSLPGELVEARDNFNASSLQSILKRIFDAMQKFVVNCKQVCEELRVRSEEDLLDQENSKVSVLLMGVSSEFYIGEPGIYVIYWWEDHPTIHVVLVAWEVLKLVSVQLNPLMMPDGGRADMSENMVLDEQ
ncbi:hypothetical protein Scep_000161 [Stephania cephalantha]|uniref:Uncharacterized protein n=1 Tax=Stephania cephalantha TaxID=152367 RepID=A0AAP0L8A8_9MAGN